MYRFYLKAQENTRLHFEVTGWAPGKTAQRILHHQLATLEGMNLVTRTTKSELARQQQICDKEVAQCKDLGVSPQGLCCDTCIRLAERLKN